SEAREVRHAERQRGPEADHRGQRGHEYGPEFSERSKPAWLRQQRAEAVRATDRPPYEDAGHHQHEGRRPVLDLAHAIHAAITDEDIQSPEEQNRQPFRLRGTTRPD